MKTITRATLLSFLYLSRVAAQDEPVYTNFIVQTQQTANSTPAYMSNIASTDKDKEAPQGVNPEGAKFELWTVSNTPFKAYLLQSTYVSRLALGAKVVIDTEDPWGKDVTSVSYANPTFATAKVIPKNAPAAVRRTRADRPFKVYVETSGLVTTDPTSPDYTKKLDFQRHLQSYGAGGTGNNLDRGQAILATPAQPQFTTNGVQNPLVIGLSSVAGADRRKLRGEETFSVWSLVDNSTTTPVPAQKLSSDYLQIWPMTDGLLSGISMNQIVRFAIPAITFKYTDTYPGSQTYAQVYKGEVRDNAEGLIIPGSHKNNTKEIPEDNLESTGSEFDRMFDSDGRWTIEVLTVSPFDTIRLHYITFTVDRTIEVNGSVTTIE